MKNLFIAFFVLMFSHQVFAADVLCKCDQKMHAKKCSDIEISFVPASPGIYMTVEYGFGKRRTEGFATVTDRSDTGEIIYRIGNFALLEKGGKYSMPARAVNCK